MTTGPATGNAGQEWLWAPWMMTAGATGLSACVAGAPEAEGAAFDGAIPITVFFSVSRRKH